MMDTFFADYTNGVTSSATHISLQVNNFCRTGLGVFSVGWPGPPMGSSPKWWNNWTSNSLSEKIGSPVFVFYEMKP